MFSVCTRLLHLFARCCLALAKQNTVSFRIWNWRALENSTQMSHRWLLSESLGFGTQDYTTYLMFTIWLVEARLKPCIVLQALLENYWKVLPHCSDVGGVFKSQVSWKTGSGIEVKRGSIHLAVVNDIIVCRYSSSFIFISIHFTWPLRLYSSIVVMPDGASGSKQDSSWIFGTQK